MSAAFPSLLVAESVTDIAKAFIWWRYSFGIPRRNQDGEDVQPVIP